jgi:YegS/Rv2252/BmrU family lipid kinase
VVFNPAAGRGRAARHASAAARFLSDAGADIDFAASTSPADLTRIAAEGSRSGYDAVVVCGGDGTLNLAIRDFDLAGSPLALIPMGSGNDFAGVVGIPKRLADACQIVLRGRAREIDVAVVNGRRYLGVAGIGFDSEVARYANERVRFLRGSPVYLYAILRVLPRFQPHRIRIDGVDEEIMFCAVGNTRQYGGGIRITPDASIDDQLLDLCIVHRTSRLQLLKTLPQAYRGKHVQSPFVEVRRASSFAIETERPLDVFADGEPVTTTPAKFSIAPEKLRVIVP